MLVYYNKIVYNTLVWIDYLLQNKEKKNGNDIMDSTNSARIYFIN